MGNIAVKLIGFLMLIAPFLVKFLFIAKKDGLKVAICLFLAGAILVSWCFVGIELLE